MADALTTPPPQVSAALSPRRRWWAVARTSLFWMVVIAFALRFGWMLAAHTYKFRTSDNNFGFGGEMQRPENPATAPCVLTLHNSER